MIKDQLFNPENYNGQQIAVTKSTLYSVGLRILQMYGNYVPHVTESIYQIVYKEKEQVNSLHQTKFDAIQTKHFFSVSSRLMESIIDVVSQVRKLKTKHELSLKTELDCLEIYSLKSEELNAFRKNEQLIRGITKAHIIEIKNEKLEESRLEKVVDKLKAAVYVETK